LALPEVAVLSLGGTISSTQTEGGLGVAPSLTGEALVEDVPEISEVAEVSADSFRQVPGSELVLEDLVELAAEIEDRIDAGAAGVVVTQGTDTIEETSFVLDLLVNRDAPVVVTGAMRNPTLPGAEGPANLLASVRVATDETARGLGAVVVLNDEIHAARFVQKSHTSNLATFRSPLAGPIGYVFEYNVRIATPSVAATSTSRRNRKTTPSPCTPPAWETTAASSSRSDGSGTRGSWSKPSASATYTRSWPNL
jgi:L-asparaginase